MGWKDNDWTTAFPTGSFKDKDPWRSEKQQMKSYTFIQYMYAFSTLSIYVSNTRLDHICLKFNGKFPILEDSLILGHYPAFMCWWDESQRLQTA